MFNAIMHIPCIKQKADWVLPETAVTPEKIYLNRRQWLRAAGFAAKLLKKNNIAVDVVSMGETEDNREKIQEFVDTVNSNDNSNLITIPPGVMPSDVLISSPVIQQDMANTGGAGGKRHERKRGN